MSPPSHAIHPPRSATPVGGMFHISFAEAWWHHIAIYFNYPIVTPSRIEAILGVLDLACRPEQSERPPRSGRRRGNNDFGSSSAGLAKTCASLEFLKPENVGVQLSGPDSTLPHPTVDDELTIVPVGKDSYDGRSDRASGRAVPVPIISRSGRGGKETARRPKVLACAGVCPRSG